MKYRIGIWASAGFLVALLWAVYFAIANKDTPTQPFVYALSRFTCPIAIAGMHFPISLYWVLIANAATYALFGVIVGTLRQPSIRAK